MDIDPSLADNLINNIPPPPKKHPTKRIRTIRSESLKLERKKIHKQSKKQSPKFDGLNYKQQLFVKAYKGNGKQAAIDAGYSPNTAEIKASKLLSMDKVRDAILARDEKITECRIKSREDLIKAFEAIAYNETTANREKIAALHEIGKLKSMYIDRVQTDLSIGIDPQSVALLTQAIAHAGSQSTPLAWQQDQSILALPSPLPALSDQQDINDVIDITMPVFAAKP